MAPVNGGFPAPGPVRTGPGASFSPADGAKAAHLAIPLTFRLRLAPGNASDTLGSRDRRIVSG